MPFWRSWGAALLGASGVALAVPVGLLLVIAITAGVSGGFGFRDLGQVAAGPALPGSTDRAAPPALPTVPPARTPRARPGAAATSASDGGTGGAGSGRPSSPGARPNSGGTGTGTDTGTGTGTDTGTPGTGTTLPAVTPAPPAAATPGPVAEVQRALEQVPVVGPAAADAVGSVAGLILPPGTLPPPSP